MDSDDSAGIPPEERSSDLGAPDVMTMRSIRDLFVREEPLVETSQFDSVLDPQEIRISVEYPVCHRAVDSVVA